VIEGTVAIVYKLTYFIFYSRACVRQCTAEEDREVILIVWGEMAGLWNGWGGSGGKVAMFGI
jgi:hypothetical protein